MSIFKPNIEKLERKQDINGLRRAVYNKDLQISQYAVEALGRIGTEGSIAALVEFVTTTAIPKNRILCAEEPLISLLNTEKKVNKLSIIEALGQLGDSRAVEPLISILDSSKDPPILKAVAKALSLLGETPAIEHKVEDFKASWIDNHNFPEAYYYYELLEALIGKEAAKNFKGDYLAQEAKIKAEKYAEKKRKIEERIRSAGIGGHFVNPEEAVNFLFRIKMAKLPVLLEPQNDESYQIVIKTMGTQPVVKGSLEEIKDILVENVNGLAKRNVCRSFSVQPFPKDANEKAAQILAEATWKQLLKAYIWKTSTKLIAYGCPELLVTEETREDWEPYMLLDLLKQAYSYGKSVNWPLFEKYPQYNEIRYHGENIYKRGGVQGMRQIYQQLINRDPSDQAPRMLDRFWDGIGPWMA